jgi:tRNA G18 (ribose-2'-O)-methylase SpoU
VSATLSELASSGFTVVALTPNGESELADVPRLDRVVLAVGAERSGLTESAIATADMRVRIDMAGGVDSLNVAAATAIACYALGPPR